MNLNSAFEVYRSTRDRGLPTDKCIEKLYPLVRECVTSVLSGIMRSVPDEGLVVTGTTDVLMAIDTFKGNAEFSTWVKGIARRICLDELTRDESGRLPHRRPPRNEDIPPAFQSYSFDSSLDGPRKDALEEPRSDFDDRYIELQERIRQRLDEQEQQILNLRFEGFATREIAELVGQPAGTVRRKITEIVSKLRASQD